MHYNEPHNIPWWHGADFGVVTSGESLPPPSPPPVLFTCGNAAHFDRVDQLKPEEYEKIIFVAGNTSYVRSSQICIT